MKGLQFAIPGLVIFAIAAFAMQLFKPSAVHTQAVVAESLAVKNAKGDLVISLGTTADGAASISFLTENSPGGGAEHKWQAVAVALRPATGPTRGAVAQRSA